MWSPSAYRRVVVETSAALGPHLETLTATDAIGVDVEMGQRLKRLPGGITKGEQILALIQIAGNGLSLLVDPLRIRDLSPLRPLFVSTTTKVFLGGATDIQLLEDRGLPVHHVVDLAEVAISVFGHKEEGMRALADRALGIQIDKAIRREDWLRRPINPAMLSYAHRDAELTLALYRWFLQEHSEPVRAHLRQHFHPVLSAEIAEWIRKFLTKRLDAARLLKELKIDPDKESERLVRDVRFAEAQDLSPGQQRRLLRLIGDLRLTALYDDVLPYLYSPSAVFRASAARALGRLRDKRAKPLLESLRADLVPDVAAAAEAGLRELETPTPAEVNTQAETAERPMNPAAMHVLEELRGQLSTESNPAGDAEARADQP